MLSGITIFFIFLAAALLSLPGNEVRRRSDPEPIRSSWDDLLEGVRTPEEWKAHKEVLRRRYLELIRDGQKPAKPPLNLTVHESVNVDGVYLRKLVSYNVEADERAHAFLAIPLGLQRRTPALVVLHGTYPRGKEREAGLEENPEKAFLDQQARRGYVVIAPDHFVAGERIPPEGAYDTKRFYEKHPLWTAVGKSVYEHAIAIDVLQTLPEVDPERIGVLGHSLGGHGAYFLAAYDPRIKVAISNSGCSTFRQNSKVEVWARDHFYIYFKHMREGLLKGFLPPIDMHEIIALIAPRPYLDLSGLNDLIAGEDPRLAGLTYRQRALMLMKVMDVYELEGAAQNFAFYAHGQGHAVTYEGRQLISGWLDKHLKEPEAVQATLIKESGFADLGIASAVSESRGVATAQDSSGKSLVLTCLLDMSTLGSLLVTDIDSGRTEQVDYPESTRAEPWAAWASYASLLSRNGRFYTFAGKVLLEFDIERRRFIFDGVPAASELCYTGSAMADGPDGRIYGASYPNCHLISFDPATKEMKDYGQLDPAEQYPDTLAFDSGGWLYCGIGTARMNIVAFNPKTREKRQILKEADRVLGTAKVFSSADGAVYGEAAGRWYRMLGGKAQAVAKDSVPQPAPTDAVRYGTQSGRFPDGRELVAHNLPERWMLIRDSRSGTEKKIAIEFRSGGAGISTLALGPDGKIYGSTMHPMHFFSYDPAGRLLSDLGPIKDLGGGNICAMAAQGRFVAGPSYPWGHFHLFDTTKLFRPEDLDDPNPIIIAQFEGDISRPRTCLAHPDREHVLMAGFMGYGRTGGGIGIVNLKTGEKQLLTHEQVVPFHSTHTLKALSNGDLIGGTSVLTPGGGHPGAKEGVLYVMDWKTKKVVFQTVPVPGAAEVFSLEVGADDLVYGVTSGLQYFVFDAAKKEIVHRERLGDWGELVRPSFLRGEDGKIYGVFGRAIARIEPGTLKVEKIATPPVTIGAGLAIDRGLIYFASRANLWRFKLPDSSY
jgi:dienelactone hydrolase